MERKERKNTQKTGRPRKEDRVKTVFRTVRFTAEEDAALTAKLEEFGGNRSDFIRKVVAGAKIVSTPPEMIKVMKTYMTDLRNIGINLNAIARRANTKELEFGKDDLEKAQTECLDFLEILQEIEKKMM